MLSGVARQGKVSQQLGRIPRVRPAGFSSGRDLPFQGGKRAATATPAMGYAVEIKPLAATA